MQSSLLIIVCLAIIVLFFYWLKKYNERVMQTLIEDADAFVDDIIKAKRLEPISTHINLKIGETAFLQCNSVLKETRNVRYHQSGHAGLRVMKGFYIGKTSGKSESQEEFQSIDMGTLTLTNKRLVFDGSSNSRNILLPKLIAVNSFRNSISVSSESRQKSMTFTVKNPLIWEFTIKLLSSIQNPLNLTDDELKLLMARTISMSQQKLDSEQNSGINEPQSPYYNPSISNTSNESNTSKQRNTNLLLKIIIVRYKHNYRIKRDNLSSKFKNGYNFLTFS